MRLVDETLQLCVRLALLALSALELSFEQVLPFVTEERIDQFHAIHRWRTPLILVLKKDRSLAKLQSVKASPLRPSIPKQSDESDGCLPLVLARFTGGNGAGTEDRYGPGCRKRMPRNRRNRCRVGGAYNCSRWVIARSINAWTVGVTLTRRTDCMNRIGPNSANNFPKTSSAKLLEMTDIPSKSTTIC